MKPEAEPLEIIFQKLPMSTALFDRQLILRRCNPTWLNYFEGVSQVAVEPGAHLYQILPGTKAIIHSYITRTLAGEITAVDSLRLNISSNVSYWDASFVPWVEDAGITGFLLVIADVTERVLSRQILERKVVDRTQKLSALYDVMTVAAEPVDLQRKLDESLQRVMDAVHAQAGTIHLLSGEGDLYLLSAHSGLAPTLISQLSEIPAGSGLHGLPVKQQQSLVDDLVGDKQTRDLLRKHSFLTYMGVPMSSRGKTLGLLSVFRKMKRPYSQEDILLLDSVADQIGTAVENARLRRDNEQLLIVEERNRLARELHDAVTQSLYSLALYAETSLRFSRTSQLEMANQYMEQVAETAQQALREMRLLLHNLRPAVLEQMGLERAIKQRVDAVEKRVGVEVDYVVSGEIALPAHVEEALYHIVQESLNNALKHAAANKISLRLSQQQNLVSLIVADDGKGFNLVQNGDGGGLGLTSMRERVASIGAHLTINSELGGGSMVIVDLDLDQSGELAVASGPHDISGN